MTTLNTYAHVMPGAEAKAVEVIAQRLRRTESEPVANATATVWQPSLFDEPKNAQKVRGMAGSRTRMLLRATNFKSVVSADSTTIPEVLLPIVFDDVFAAHVRDARILPRVAARAALTQEIPILVEPHRDRIEAIAVVRRQRSVLAVLEQTVLFARRGSRCACVSRVSFMVEIPFAPNLRASPDSVLLRHPAPAKECPAANPRW